MKGSDYEELSILVIFILEVSPECRKYSHECLSLFWGCRSPSPLLWFFKAQESRVEAILSKVHVQIISRRFEGG